MPFMIVIDGPNFINELHRHGKNKEYIMNKLSFPILHSLIQQKILENGLSSHPFLHTEFICSNKPKIGKFRGEERVKLLAKLRRQTGVSVRIVELSSKGEQEKGVDMTVFSTMLERGGLLTHIVLIGADRDYVPAQGDSDTLTGRPFGVVSDVDVVLYENMRPALPFLLISDVPRPCCAQTYQRTPPPIDHE